MGKMELLSLTDQEKLRLSQETKVSEQDVKILSDWFATQPHLPQNLQYDNFFEKILARNKLSIERAKKKIEAYFTLKGQNKDFYKMFAGDGMTPLSNSLVTCVFLPKLGPMNERIFCIYIKPLKSIPYNSDHFIQQTLASWELAMRYDHATKIRVIGDGENFSLEYMKTINVVKLHRLMTLLLNGFSNRLAAIDLINVGAGLQLFLTIFKRIVKVKIFNRIQVHSSLEAFHKSIGKEYLPIEFGGTEGTFDDLMVKMDHSLRENQEYLIQCGKIVSDERKRMGPSNINEMFGVDGTFKTLALD